MDKSETSLLRPRVNELATERSGGIVKKVIALVVAMVMLASFGVTISLYNPSWPSRRYTPKPRPQSSGQSSSANVVVQMMKASMNPKRDPCTEFYSFVCGNYKSQFGSMLNNIDGEMYQELHRILEKESIPTSRQSAPHKAGALYKLCATGRNNEKAALQRFLATVGLDNASYPNAKALDKVLLLFFRYNLNTLLGFTITEGLLYKGKRELRVELNEKQLSWFKSRHGDTGVVFYRDTLDLPQKEIIRVENKAAALLTHKVLAEMADLSLTTVLGLEELTPTANRTGGRWSTLVETYSNRLYLRDYEVQVSKGGLKYFDRLYDDLGNRELSLLTAWEVLRRLMPLTVPSLAGLFTRETYQRWCRDAVFDAMEVPLISWYLYGAVPHTALRQGRTTLAHIRLTIMEEIRNSRWLDNVTRKVVLDKVNALAVHAGYPLRMSSPRALDKVYSGFPEIGARFLDPWLDAMGRTVVLALTNDSTFRFSVRNTYAAYMPHRNKIVVPATLFREPVFSLWAPKAVWYGGLGAIAGHEIMHAFGRGPIVYNADGKSGNWWTRRCLDEYEERIACLRGMHNTANQSMDSEMLADFAGLVAAYDAFKSVNVRERQRAFPGFEYTAEQLFFISFCMKLCSENPEESVGAYTSWRHRCQIPLRNLGAFGEAFHCPVGSYMWIYNASHRCSFW